MEVRTVLCPVDFSGRGSGAVGLARQLCKRFDARLVLEHNLDPRPPSFLTVTWMWSEEFEGQQEDKAGEAQEQLQALLAEISASIDCEAKLTRGPIDEVLPLLVKELSADLVVMGSRGWSTSEHQSLTEKMISKCPAPVLTTGNAEGEPPSLFVREDRDAPVAILVTVDTDRKVAPALIYAAQLAAEVGGGLTLLEVLPPDVAKAGEARLREATERVENLLEDAGGVAIRARVVEGEELSAILREVDEGEIDLVVRPVHSGMMPWKKRRRQTDFELLHRSPCPVLYVPEK